MIVRTATAVQKRHGNLVLLEPQPVVWMALEKTHIPEIIGVHLRLDEAVTGVQGEPLKPIGGTA